jgi:redox-sensitive bicupin YhaK (pirin superfamily)
MAKLKEVLGIYESGSSHWVGDGFHVRNLIPSTGLESEVSPFLLLDYAGPTDFAPTDKPRGVGEHPHRGFETVTIAYQGKVEHRDSGGNAGTIGPGDVQWMTAASGVVHEEKHERNFSRAGGTFEMIQLWVNLPRALKMSPPRYQTLLSGQIPQVDFPKGGYARVIAGELNGVKGAASTFTPVNLFDVRVKAGEVAELSVPAGFNTAVFLLRGSVVLNSSQALEGEAKIALLDAKGELLKIEAKQDSLLLALGGQPIDEPVASYGPFVMNTREEVAQAVEDYRAGKMGHLR